MEKSRYILLSGMFPFKEDAWKTHRWVVRFEVLEAEQLLTWFSGLVSDDDDDNNDNDDDRYGSSWIVTVSQVVSCSL